MSDEFSIHALIERVGGYGERVFLATADATYSYADLIAALNAWDERLAGIDLGRGVVGLATDYSLTGVAALLALWRRGACVALLPRGAAADASYAKSGRLSYRLVIDDESPDAVPEPLGPAEDHPLLERLRDAGRPGLILFSSGSSGEPKAILHDLTRFLTKFSKPGKQLVTYAFLVFDHVAGQDTMLYTMNAGGVLVASPTRRPKAVAKMLERHSVQVLPASPTFLNLLLTSGAHEAHDLSSLEIITYGSEPMNQDVLDGLATALPGARIIQKYGTSEFGAVRSRSKSNTSLFINIKEDETQAQVRDGILWIQSPGTMLGYLNAEAAFDADGWICTGDMVEQDGDWLRILGRASDLINVGGEKVIPAEVENCIMELDFVIDATVRGEANPLTGTMVAADVMVNDLRDVDDAKAKREVVKEIRKHCRGKLAPHKVPAKVLFTERSSATERQKKIRR